MNDRGSLPDGVVRITAANPGPMTGAGTNTYLIGHERLVIIDPGPSLPTHLAAIEAAVGGRPVEAVLVTHTHRDHTESARQVAEAFNAPLTGAGPHQPYRALREGEVHGLEKASDKDYAPQVHLEEGSTVGGDVAMQLVPTPGHTRNHVSFAGEGFILTGDHVMGWSSSIIAPPDGHMGDYLASLKRLIEMPDAIYLPGHGSAIEDGKARARDLLRHRLAREAQIEAILHQSADPMTADAVAAIAYPDLPPNHAMAGVLSSLAHLEYLVEQKRAVPLEDNRFQRT